MMGSSVRRGMVCAFFHPRYEAALKWIDERPGPARVAIQSAILAVTLAVSYWWYNAYYLLPKLEYNVVHPYTSWIPITCFIILRNLTQGLRSWRGKFLSTHAAFPCPPPPSQLRVE